MPQTKKKEERNDRREKEREEKTARLRQKFMMVFFKRYETTCVLIPTSAHTIHTSSGRNIFFYSVNTPYHHDFNKLKN